MAASYNSLPALLLVLALLTPAGAPRALETVSASDAARLLEEGRALLDADRVGQALEKFRAAREISPESAEEHYLSGLAHAKAGDTATAIEDFLHAVEFDPSLIEAREQLALYYEAHDQLDQAIAEYSAIVQWAAPDSEPTRMAIKRIRYLTATQHAKQKNLDIALALFKELVDQYPDDALFAYSAGVAYMLKGHMEEAGVMFERTIRLDPGYLNAYVNLATVDEARGDVDAAVAALKHVVNAGPDSPAAGKASTRLAIIEAKILVQEGNLSDAVAAYERVLEHDPSNSVALKARAELYRRLGDQEGERKAYEDLVAQRPGDIAARHRLAEIYLAQKQYAGAYAQLSAVLETQDDGGVHRQAVRKMFSELMATAEGKRIDRARNEEKLRSLEDQVEKEPENAAALKSLAILHYRLEEYQAAAASLERLIRLEPTDEGAHISLAGLYDRLGRFEESTHEYLWLISHAQDIAAAAQYVRALKLVNAKRLFVAGDLRTAGNEFGEILAEDPANSVAYFYLGLIYSREDDIAGAVDAYKEVVRQVPTHVGARLNLAYSYERLNREEDAIDEYKKILQANPSREMAEMVKLRLDNLQKRIDGITVGLGYLLAYDSNSNLSDINVTEELRSDLSLNLSYQYKTEQGYRWRLSAQPVYSNYHEGQYDYLNSSETVAVSTIRDALTVVGGYTYRTTDGLLIESRLSRMHTLFGEVLSRVRLPNLLGPRDDLVSSTVSMNLSYSDFDSSSSPFFSSYTSAGGISLSQPATSFDTVRLGYSYVRNENKEFVGSDYAYTGHGLSAGLDHFTPWGGINMNLGFTLFNYINPDSFSQFTQRRRNFRSNLALGATYRYRPDLSLFVTLAWTDNRSNLPVGFILNSEDIIEGQQSSSLSDYRRTVLTTGVNLRF